MENNDKEKWVYSGYGIVFDGADSLNFSNGFAKNFVIFGFDNSSLFHVGNRINNLLLLGESPSRKLWFTRENV